MVMSENVVGSLGFNNPSSSSALIDDPRDPQHVFNSTSDSSKNHLLSGDHHMMSDYDDIRGDIFHDVIWHLLSHFHLFDS